MKQSLEQLLADGVIDEVVGQLKSGKEAEVWLVRRGEEIIAAKVYLERDQRRFRNNAAYKEGRQVRNSRTQRAIDKGSRFGRQAEEDAWKAAESDALYKLHAMGVRVPQPVMFYEGVLLMEVVVDPEGYPAPRVADAVLGPEAGRPLYEELREQMIKMLCADLIHGDLSPFNVLLAWNGPTIIDFPQVISSAHNNRAEHFFRRDFETIRNFCAALDPSLHQHESDVDQIWRAYVRRDLTPSFVPVAGLARTKEARPPRGERAGGGRFRDGRAHVGGSPAGGSHSGGAPRGRDHGGRAQHGGQEAGPPRTEHRTHSPSPSSGAAGAPDRGGQSPRAGGGREQRQAGRGGGRSLPEVSYRGQVPETSRSGTSGNDVGGNSPRSPDAARPTSTGRVEHSSSADGRGHRSHAPEGPGSSAGHPRGSQHRPGRHPNHRGGSGGGAGGAGGAAGQATREARPPGSHDARHGQPRGQRSPGGGQRNPSVAGGPPHHRPSAEGPRQGGRPPGGGDRSGGGGHPEGRRRRRPR